MFLFKNLSNTYFKRDITANVKTSVKIEIIFKFNLLLKEPGLQ